MKHQTPRIETGVRTDSDSTNESISTSVVAAVADSKGVDPLDLKERLFDVVDPDALDALFEPGPFGAERDQGTVTFAMAGCEVVVRADGDVSATPIEG